MQVYKASYYKDVTFSFVVDFCLKMKEQHEGYKRFVLIHCNETCTWKMHSVNFTQLWTSTCALKCSTLMCFHFNMWFKKKKVNFCKQNCDVKLLFQLLEGLGYPSSSVMPFPLHLVEHDNLG